MVLLRGLVRWVWDWDGVVSGRDDVRAPIRCDWDEEDC